MKLLDSLDGFSLGGGGEVKVGGAWTLKLDYRWTHLGREFLAGVEQRQSY